ncbi:sodium/potassium/calcium exchanger 2-like [Hydractinia symbiolongicarpus]|uniref:sodium/potassium/calcium exchanger 2-like n=1 Tax=Hydractinia symbiolongicarpus TaxID=13093 RepID=UPI00254AA975|nr:sodium/potassium/calcium exchanger 2-like [Hydractinia symbiolongicarpus]XP_057306677.1 sodium/potassium/calcium exchanger 2-like [Hydractinia symbiolongicarpus]
MRICYDRRMKATHSQLRLVLNVVVFIAVLSGVVVYTTINDKLNLKLYRKTNENVYGISSEAGKKLKTEKKAKLVQTSKVKTAHTAFRVPFVYRASSELYRSRTLLNTSEVTDTVDENYPEDIFTAQEKKDGAIVLHVIGICYMFLALALVCDEFFVPALHLISKIANISDDVAGATFMAAGGSAPELFISVIGVFISKSNVGFGTIVGSAVFNILFVIGMCAIFSKVLLELTWWPLLRDSLFYILALVILISFFYDTFIEWWEALVLFSVYIAYVTFMVFNERIERYVKSKVQKKKTKKTSIITPLQEKHKEILFALSNNLEESAFRHGALQLVIHTLDPIAEETVERKLSQFRDHCDSSFTTKETSDQSSRESISIDKNSNLIKVNSATQKESYGELKNRSSFDYEDSSMERDNLTRSDTIEDANQMLKELDAMNVPRESAPVDEGGGKENKLDNRMNFPSLETNENNEGMDGMESDLSLRENVKFSTREISRSSSRASLRSHRGLAPAQQFDVLNVEEREVVKEGDDEEEGPVDISWPDTFFARLFYVIKAPLMFLLIVTLPDVRRPKLWKLFPITFLGSILWIGGFTYLMVWWAAEVGKTLGIPDEVMGLTFLAAGTSIPDLITSVVVARQGLGDMAVSSSIGSNIFDVTVGLPLPWLIHSLINGAAAVNVKSDGLFCSTILLFIMLLSVVATIALSKWKMTKLLGATMFLLYVVFITVTLLIQLEVWSCFL